MSDIFISYSKADHALALQLSAFLEAEGWSVRWDKSLGAADLYRDEIMKQLAAARAVITIWSPNSVKSDWVRAEAGRAKADGKLIPVKTPDLAYADIPLPFGEMHTENVVSAELIRTVIAARLTKPSKLMTLSLTKPSKSSVSPTASKPPSQDMSLGRYINYQILTWLGIVGTSITLFANLHAILNMADWANLLVRYWNSLAYTISGSASGWIGIPLSFDDTYQLLFLVFMMMIVIGLALSSRVQLYAAATRVGTLAIGLTVYVVVLILLRNISIDLRIANLLFNAWVVTFPTGFLMYYCTDRFWTLVASLLYLSLATCIAIMPFASDLWALTPQRPDIEVKWNPIFVFAQICQLPILWLSPSRQLARRLGFLVIFVIALVALNELSRLSLQQYLQPPKVSDNSVR